MSLLIIDEKQRLTKDFIKYSIKYYKNVKGTLLQNDTSNLIEEKVISIGIAYVFMWLVGLILTFTGVGIVLFIAGYVLSRVVNTKIYGKERSLDMLNDDERHLLELIDAHIKQLKSLKIRVSLKSQRNKVLFIDYPIYTSELAIVANKIRGLNPQHLSFKYRLNYLKLVESEELLFTKLDHAYQI